MKSQALAYDEEALARVRLSPASESVELAASPSAFGDRGADGRRARRSDRECRPDLPARRDAATIGDQPPFLPSVATADEMAGEIAAVDGGNYLRPERPEDPRVSYQL